MDWAIDEVDEVEAEARQTLLTRTSITAPAPGSHFKVQSGIHSKAAQNAGPMQETIQHRRRGSAEPCVFPPSRLRFTLNAGSKNGLVSHRSTLALRSLFLHPPRMGFGVIHDYFGWKKARFLRHF